MGLKRIARSWRNCTKCALRYGRNRVVVGERFGLGTGPRLVIVGEAPGAVEDEEGRPFIGPSGKLLRECYLKAAGIDNAYITNMCACRPFRNRSPSTGEIDACSPRLWQIAEAFRPEGIVHVGRTADKAFEGLDLPRARVYHPAYILRQGWPNKAAKKLARAQAAAIKKLLVELDGDEEKAEELPAKPITVGSFYFHGDKIADFVVDSNTAEPLCSIPRKMRRKR